jgi:hypothetical protein
MSGFICFGISQSPFREYLIKAAIIIELELGDIEMNLIFGHGVKGLDDATLEDIQEPSIV